MRNFCFKLQRVEWGIWNDIGGMVLALTLIGFKSLASHKVLWALPEFTPGKCIL